MRIRRWLTDTAGGLPRQFWYLWTTTLVNRIGSFVLVVLALYLTQRQGFSETYAGFVIGLWGAGAAVGTLVGGVLADRWGRKPTFVTALYAGAAMMLVLGFLRGHVAVAVSVFVLGLFSEASRPAMQALMVDIVAPGDRMRAFSLNYWVVNLGFACSALLAGLVAGIDFRLLFILDAATTVAAATFVAVAVSEPVRAGAPVPARGSPPVRAGAPAGRAGRSRVGLAAVFGDRVFMAFVLVNLLTAIIFMQHLSTLPLAMTRDGLTASTYGSVIALNGVLIVVGQLFVARLLVRMRRATALATASIVIGVGFGLTALADTPLVYAVTVLVWTVGEMLHAPSNSALNAELAPADLRGRYQGVFSLSWSAASFLAPILGGAVLQYAGPTTLWLGCLALAVVAAAVNLLAGPSRERRAAALAAAETPLPQPTPALA
jgi:predicted MFS family arabinose efflux permease